MNATVDFERVDRALDGLYDAAVAPAAWADALHRLARAMGAVCCRFYPSGAGAALLRYPASHDYQPFLEEFVRDGWWRTDHRAERGWPLLAGGRKVLTELDIVSEDERRRLPQYHDLYRRYDVSWWAAVSFQVGGRLWAVPFLRSERQGPFTPAEASVLSELAPHFERILRVSERFVEGSTATAMAILERIDCGAFLLGSNGTVVRSNGAAEALIGYGLRLNGKRLAAADRRSDAAFQNLIAAALESNRPARLQTGPVALRRPDQLPLIAEAVPVAHLLADTFEQSGVILFVVDPEKRLVPGRQVLQEGFGLTPAEARVASAVAAGHDLTAIAEAFGTARETVRTQLKVVLAKTGTGRQTELAALLTRLGQCLGVPPEAVAGSARNARTTSKKAVGSSRCGT